MTTGTPPAQQAAAVPNQPPPLAGYDAFGADTVLVGSVLREGADWATPELHALGALAGDAEVIEWGFQADRNPPVLRSHDRYGNRLDEVEFHPAWHALMDVAVRHGTHAAPWAEHRIGGHVARAAAQLVWTQVDAGVSCPMSMTYAAVPVLRLQPELAAVWEPLLASREYDPGLRAPGFKRGLLCGMGMTERQGGSDVRLNTTTAVPDAGAWRLDGHKWFCSAPMSDGFLILAQAPGGLSCFLVPRVLAGGERNGIRLQRLKPKLGNRSNASAEIELQDAAGWLVGEQGRGVATMARMVNLTRLDCALGTAALIRQAVAQAVHHAEHRSAFGRRLADQPLMTAVLADLALESEAATTLAMRLAGAADRAERPGPTAEHEASLRRIGTAVAKYWVCKRGPAVTGEALECLGGNGYVEESIMPRLYREAPVNSIWEGSGNVNVLDVLRAVVREPATVDALLTELDRAAGGDHRLDRWVLELRQDLARLPGLAADPGGAAHRTGRRLVERMALALQAALLVRHAPQPVADAFCASRLGAGGWSLGTLPESVGAGTLSEIVSRHSPNR